MIRGVALTLALAATGCAAPRAYRVHDPRLDVTCWVVVGEGVACLPDRVVTPPAPVFGAVPPEGEEI